AASAATAIASNPHGPGGSVRGVLRRAWFDWLGAGTARGRRRGDRSSARRHAHRSSDRDGLHAPETACWLSPALRRAKWWGPRGALWEPQEAATSADSGSTPTCTASISHRLATRTARSGIVRRSAWDRARGRPSRSAAYSSPAHRSRLADSTLGRKGVPRRQRPERQLPPRTGMTVG